MSSSGGGWCWGATPSIGSTSRCAGSRAGELALNSLHGPTAALRQLTHTMRLHPLHLRTLQPRPLGLAHALHASPHALLTDVCHHVHPRAAGSAPAGSARGGLPGPTSTSGAATGSGSSAISSAISMSMSLSMSGPCCCNKGAGTPGWPSASAAGTCGGPGCFASPMRMPAHGPRRLVRFGVSQAECLRCCAAGCRRCGRARTGWGCVPAGRRLRLGRRPSGKIPVAVASQPPQPLTGASPPRLLPRRCSCRCAGRRLRMRAALLRCEPSMVATCPAGSGDGGGWVSALLLGG